MARQPSFSQAVTSYKGRLNRQGFFWYQTAVYVIVLAVVYASAFLLSNSFSEASALVGIIAIGAGLAMIYADVMMTIARLHDINKSAWWLLLMLVPYLNVIFSIYLLFAKSYPFTNRWGEPIDGTVPYRGPQPEAPKPAASSSSYSRPVSPQSFNPLEERKDYTHL